MNLNIPSVILRENFDDIVIAALCHRKREHAKHVAARHTQGR